MSIINKILKDKWEPIEPFERAKSKQAERRILKDGETEYEVCEEFVHIVEYNGDPPKIIKLTIEEIEILKNDPIGFRDSELKKEKCFLWIITNDSLKIAKEKMRNIKRTHMPDFICHTNLSGAQKAYIGGEIFFGEDGFVYVNYFSDRYGGVHTPAELWEASKGVFVELGYTKLVDIHDYI
ncbi:MAG: hypothetical protein WAT43_15240 [Chitinophagales bacterium]